MVCTRLLLNWVLSDRNNKKKRGKRLFERNPYNLHALESQITLCDEVDGRGFREEMTTKRPLIYFFIGFWAYFEIVVLAIVLVTKKHHHDNYDNFLHGFCTDCDCQDIIFKAIIWKVATTLLLIIGSKSVSQNEWRGFKCSKKFNSIYSHLFVESYSFFFAMAHA